ncbi:hypothetical protein OEZ49_17985 [Ruegeria sp. WL0004]|uniref:Uncharacterized protein n=1 Tax=Ruegeria marisflavi TaxID=2984152 RepID=A0ABT2X0H0_9RHOB|nr:hypothetical protein [Ruegeria sp. WL0004]MCU9839668.1 hypothetical protein [Ruegeria sp. WL0004]
MSNWITAAGNIEASTSNLAPAEQDHHQTRAPAYEVGRGGYEVSNGELTHSTGHNHSFKPNDDETTGLLSTVRTEGGSVVVGRTPKGSDVIMYQGMGISLNVAATMGLVTRNHDGSFSEKLTISDPTAKAKAQMATAEGTDTGTKNDAPQVTFGEAGDAAMADLMANQMPGNLFKTVDSILHTGDMDKATIERMASMAGVEPSEMEAKVATVWQGAYDAATDFMADAGIENGEAFQAFITSDTIRKANMLEAARNYFVHHNTEGLQAMADAYLPHMDRYEGARVRELLTAAGKQFSERPGGGLNVIVDGQQVSFEVAVKQKLISFSRG